MENAAVRPAASSRKMNCIGSNATMLEIITVTSSENMAVRESKNTNITAGTAANGTR